MPIAALLSKHLTATILGTFIMLATYTLFYIMTVYSMSYGTAPGPGGPCFLWMLMVAVIGFGVMVPIAGLLADRFGRRKTMITITLMLIAFAFLFPSMLGSGSQALVYGLPAERPERDGADFRPDGRAAAGAVPDRSALYRCLFLLNLSSILGASVAPYIATWLNANYGLQAVGYYLAAMAALMLITLIACKETRHQTLYEAV